MGVFLSDARWTREVRDDVTIHKLGDVPDLDKVIAALGTGDNALQAVGAIARAHVGFHACVIEAGGNTVAWVDRLRSYPLFFSPVDGAIYEDPEVAQPPTAEVADPSAVIELAMAGYTFGDRTLRSDVRQLRAGEAVLAKGGRTETSRYYTYRPTGERRLSIEAIATTVDEIFEELARRAGDTPIWVPLSGGWDSRLVLAKLVEHRARDLKAFTYGTPSGHEVAVARQVAEKLGVPWSFLPSRGTDLRTPAADERRCEYWRHGGRLSSVPSMAGYLGLIQLADSGRLNPGDLIVNGQSGDYITGGHIPRDLVTNPEATEDSMIRTIVGKHLSLWKSLMSEENLAVVTADLRREIAETYGEVATREDLALAYESWEYHERQAKFVVNDQRLYEFVGARWMLPLWDARFVDLWTDVHVEDKLGQRTFLRYLQAYDYAGIFTSIPHAVWRWPRRYSWVVPVARAIGLARGSDAKEAFYERMRYHGRYKDQWESYGSATYKRHVGDMRNPVSLNARKMLDELGIAWPG